MTDEVRPKDCGPILARIVAEAAKLGFVDADDAPPCEWPEGQQPAKAPEPEEPEPWWNK